MESENFGHQHTVVLLNELEQSDECKIAYCSRCGEKVSPSVPSFGCVEKCGFSVHRQCGEAPMQINHPCHPNHPLLLLPNSPYAGGLLCVCDFCEQECMRFVYHCSCKLDLHIKCALFTYNVAQKNFKELEHVAVEGTKNDGERHQHLIKCFGCWQPVANSTYFSLDCGFNLHTRCADLPLKINHMNHPNHPLVVQFNSEWLSCKMCQETQRRGFVYGCQSCKFVVHIGCVSASPLPIIEDENHPHPFTLFQRQVPFICDGCGTEGQFFAYICSACHIMVHKECISLPHIIKSKWHDHHIFHKYFFQGDDFRSCDCIICHKKVDVDHGSYSCSNCKFMFHVNCVKKYDYYVVKEAEKSSDISINSFTCVKWNDVGEATEIEHIMHRHNLILSDKIMEYDNCCNGCLLPIHVPFYYCSLCDFSLHKACAEFPKMKHLWFHHCQQPLILRDYSDRFFNCTWHTHQSNGFAYECINCGGKVCLQSVIASTTVALSCSGHEHSLYRYNDNDYEGKYCNGCGFKFRTKSTIFYCKVCNYFLCYSCRLLPIRARHKCDEHLLTLTYHDDNDYSEYHYCDICEEKRDPNHWSYHCTTCNSSAHPYCVFKDYPFIKSGSVYEQVKDHSHPITFVRKIYYYPKCIICDKPCQDLALECATYGCNYIVHWDCIRPRYVW